jgi:hypothetical protein
VLSRFKDPLALREHRDHLVLRENRELSAHREILVLWQQLES